MQQQAYRDIDGPPLATPPILRIIVDISFYGNGPQQHTCIHTKHVRIICPYQERHGVPSAMEIRDEVGIYSLIGCKRMETERVSSVYGRCNMRPRGCVCVCEHPPTTASSAPPHEEPRPTQPCSTLERALPSARLAARQQQPTCLQRRPTSSAPQKRLISVTT